METKVYSKFWSDPEIEPQPHDVKLAALWLLTNERVNLLGYAEVTEKRFAYDTGLPPEALTKAFEALGKPFPRFGEGYWIRRYIRLQFGEGDSLARNNMFKPLVRAWQGLQDEALKREIAKVYPEFAGGIRPEGLGALFEAQEKSREEKSREEKSEGDRGVGKEGRGKKRPAAESGAPADFAEPIRTRLLELGRIFRRQPKTRWGADELAALRAAGLDTQEDAAFAEDVAAMLAFYHADIPREMAKRFWRRTGLVRVLRSWPEELDKAREWSRHLAKNDGGLHRLGEGAA